MVILGISCFYHESAAAILKNGQILAASAEERFSRIKHDSSFPRQSIDFCLKQAGIKSSDLDYVVFYEKPFLKFERNLTTSVKYFPRSYSLFVDSMRNFLAEKLWIKSIIASQLKIAPSKILFVPHHLSHAASSFYPSPFETAAFLTLDGVGEWTSGSWGLAIGHKLNPIGEIKFPDSVGLMYSTFTSFLGFTVNDGEYKVMGMAGYGQPRFISQIKKLYHQNKDGTIRLNLDYFSFHLSSQKMYSEKFIKEFDQFNQDQQSRFDLAASLQEVTLEIVLNIVNFIWRQTKQDYLVFGGGVALNSVINAKIIQNSPFKELFIFPAAGDDGGAVGAALYVYHHVLGYKKRSPLKDAFLGAQFKYQNSKFKKLTDQKLIQLVASKLADGQIVGWFEGRAEFGPRALGHRSIIADPRNLAMKDYLNSQIKLREEFRPFAPAILEESASQYFSSPQTNLAKYMLGTFKAKPKALKLAPATVHVDGTSRIQIVDKNYPGRFRKLLEHFFKLTGVPILLNTSFNLKGEPIVNSPEDAYQTFRESNIDILVIENYLIEKD